MLRKYLPQTDFQTTEPLSVLSLACGDDHEASTIEHYFNPASNQAYHVGIDRDQESILTARGLYLKHPNYHFIRGDLAKRSTLKQLEKFATQYDLLIMRHAPIMPEGDLWQRVLLNYSQYLRPGGLLLITTYYKEELETLQREGLPSCYQIMVSERNRARVFNRRLHRMATREMMGILMASVLSGKEPDLKFKDSLGNIMRRDQYLVLATKV